MSRVRWGRHSLPAVLAAGLIVWSGPGWASSVTELVREARVHEAAHEDDIAVRRYSDALALDPTCEEAYLGLGQLRMRNGDSREAERVYSVALEHVPHLRIALAGRAHARRAMGARDGAEEDLGAFAVLEEDTGALRELAGWFGEDGRTAAALATWRRMLALGARAGDAGLVHEARAMVRALQILVGPADPVIGESGATRGAAADGGARRAMAAIARRGG